MSAVLMLCLAAAAVERVALVAVVEGGGAELSLSAVHRRAAVVVERFAEAQLVPGDDALSCGADRSCIAAALRAAGAKHGLIAVVDAAQSPPVLLVRLLDAGGAPRGEFAGPPSVEEGGLGPALELRTARLLEGAGYVRGVRLEVKTIPAGARVTVDGAVAGEARLRPGLHLVRAGAEGRETVERVIELNAGEERSIELVLPPAAGGLLESPWLWAVVAGAVLAAAFSAAALASDRGRPACVCFDISCGDC